jgi:hypothetical protein
MEYIRVNKGGYTEENGQSMKNDRWAGDKGKKMGING